MSANDNKRYYWLKLKKDFFEQHQMKVLKALPNGRLYALIYLELLAESVSHDGELRYSKTLPYDIVTLSSVIGEDKDNVEKAIETLEKLELVEILSDSTIYMRDIQKLIGNETGQTIRKNEAKMLEGKSRVKNTLENRDKSIEIRVKNSSSRYIEAGYDPKIIKNISKFIQRLNLISLDDKTYSKIVDAYYNEEIIDKEDYVYTMLKKKGLLDETNN